MAIKNVDIGDLVEYHVHNSKKKFGIYLGSQPWIEGLQFIRILGHELELIFPDGVETIKISVRSSVKKAKG